jgi:hypothetical protein
MVANLAAHFRTLYGETSLSIVIHYMIRQMFAARKDSSDRADSRLFDGKLDQSI